MKTKILPLILFALFVCGPTWAASPEEAYLEARNELIAKFTGQEGADQASALANLEGRLRTIIGPVAVEGFSGAGKINLETLNETADFGFGNVDGLRFTNRGESVLVTTPYLLKLYYEKTPKPAKDLPELNLAALAGDGKFLEAAFGWNAVVTLYAEVPVNSMDGRSIARAFLGLGAQDVGPFVPDMLFVTATKGDRILFAYSRTPGKLPELPQCTTGWSKSDQGDRAFGEFAECYGKAAKSQPFFSILTRQAQLIVDRLQK